MPVTDVLAAVEAVLVDRRDGAAPAGSYSATLVTDPVRAQRKVMEEAFELCLELGRPVPDPARTAEEAADLVFHVLAGLVGAGVAWADVVAVLEARRRP